MSTESYKRKLAAIISADVEGYSRLMGLDETGTIRTLTAYKEAMSDLIVRYHGRVVDAPGDNILAEFASVVDAVQCAVEVQREFAERNQEISEEKRMQFRIGVNLGDVVEEADRLYGDGVNIAARVEGLCETGGVCISGTAFEHVENKLDLEFVDIGEHDVKNITKPVRVYRVLSHPGAAADRVAGVKKAAGKTRLNRMLVAAAVFIGLAATGLWFTYFRFPANEVAPVEKKASTVPDKPSIAVLPFTNLSDDPGQEFFADGMTDELITDLSKISDLLVISRNSSFTYKGKTVNLQQVARELKVNYVLEGSIQRAGNRVRIRAQLIDGSSDHHLWAESYDAVMENIFDLQDEITRKVAAELAVKLKDSVQVSTGKERTTNIDAYDAFVKGWDYLHRETPDDLVRAISFFKEAIENDPSYSRAHAALAWAYISSSLRFEWQYFIHEHKHFRLMARKHLDIAMRNPSSTAHLVASKMALYRRKYDEAAIHARRALAFFSNDPDAILNMAWVLMATGKPAEGLDYVDKTLQLDPRNMADSLNAAGMAHYIIGDMEKAANLTERSLKHNPAVIGRYQGLSSIYAHLGRKQDASKAYSESLKAWSFCDFPSDLTTVMTSVLVKDRNFTDRYAEGLVKAGWSGKSFDYYKINEEHILTGERIQELISGQEITVDEFGQTFWINHSADGRFVDISRVTEGKWWVEEKMLCYQLASGKNYGLNDCGEIYRNSDATPESGKQYLHVKDYTIAALTVN